MILYLPIPGALAGLACLLCVQEGYLIGKEKKKESRHPMLIAHIYNAYLFFFSLAMYNCTTP